MIDMDRVPPHVQRASGMLVAKGQQILGASGPFRATVVQSQPRTHSTIHVITLTNGRETRRFYLKTLNASPDSGARKLIELKTEYQILNDLWKYFARFPHLGVVKPVACMPEDLSLLIEEFPGQKLDAILAHVGLFQSRRQIDRIANLCGLVGEWLRHFQAFTAPPEVSWFDVSEIFAYCDDRLRIIVDSPNGHLGRELSRTIMTHLKRLAIDIDKPELELTGRQNDFRPDNMLMTDNRIVVLDFTGFTYGPRLYDFMKFWMRLDYLSFGPFSVARAVELTKRSFAEGYGHRVDLASPMAELLRLANILDKMSELVETVSHPVWRRVLEKQWYKHLYRQMDSAVGVRR